jgi:DNA-binding transcriptional LysR family regulator
MATTALHSLNAFLEVARRRSFAAAARALGVSPSALSQAVQKLEARLGVPLLNRTSRSVATTEAGQRLLEDAGPALALALDALKAVSERSGEIAGHLRLSVPTAAVTMVLDRLLPAFVARHPQIEIEVRVENQFVNIVAEAVDAGIRLTEAIERDMVQIRLSGPTRVVVAASPAYLARRGTPQTPADLLHHDCICFQGGVGGSRFAWELERGKKDFRVPVQGPVTTNDHDLRRRLAVAGVGLIYTLEPLIADDVRSGRLCVVLEPYAPHVPGLFLYFPNRAQVSPSLRALVDLARELAAPPKRRST